MAHSVPTASMVLRLDIPTMQALIEACAKLRQSRESFVRELVCEKVGTKRGIQGQSVWFGNREYAAARPKPIGLADAVKGRKRTRTRRSSK